MARTISYRPFLESINDLLYVVHRKGSKFIVIETYDIIETFLKLPHFFLHLHGKGISAVISKLACSSQKRIRSYNVLGLGGIRLATQLQDLPLMFQNKTQNVKESQMSNSLSI